MTKAKLKQKLYDLMVNITVSMFIILAFFHGGINVRTISVATEASRKSALIRS